MDAECVRNALRRGWQHLGLPSGHCDLRLCSPFHLPRPPPPAAGACSTQPAQTVPRAPYRLRQPQEEAGTLLGF